MASDLTPLRNRPYPAESDVPDVAADIKALALSLEHAPNVAQGTLATRPTTGMAAGDRYYVTGDATLTNNGIEWFYDGNQWTQISYESPIGAGDIWFAANDPADTRWLICDGRAISRSQYATLFALIGTTYGSGNGSSTFNIPDLRQRMPMGLKGSGSAGSGQNLGERGGTIDHTHAVPGLSVPSLSVPSLSIPALSIPSIGVQVNSHTHTLSGNGGAQLNIQPYASTDIAVFQNTGAVGASFGGFRVLNNVSPAYQSSPTSQAAVALCGNTDSDGATGYTNGGWTGGGATGAGATGTGVTGGGNTDRQNAPYLTVNFIIRVA